MPTEQLSEEVTTGLDTTPDERRPYGVRVRWIAWNSPFRGTALAIGDRIVAVDGEPLDPTSEDVTRSQYVGAIGEPARWTKRGASEGRPVVLTVRRGAAELTVEGALRARRSWRGDDGKPLLAPEGPDTFSNGGFGGGGWGSWYEKLVELLRITLDGSWRGRIDNRGRLRELLGEKPRVDALAERWPGPFSRIAADDFAAAVRYLEGRTYQLTPKDLAYRGLGAARAAELQSAAKAARAAFLAAHQAEIIPLFPVGDPMSIGVREQIAGRIVVLPPFGRGTQWQTSRRNYYAAGDDRQGYYFVDTAGEAMERVFAADWRYMTLIDPRPKYPYAIIGRIGPNPTMVVRDGRAYTGFSVEPLAVTIGDDAVFVDLTQRDGDISRYAGEPDAPPAPSLAPDLSPSAVKSRAHARRAPGLAGRGHDVDGAEVRALRRVARAARARLPRAAPRAVEERDEGAAGRPCNLLPWRRAAHPAGLRRRDALPADQWHRGHRVGRRARSGAGRSGGARLSRALYPRGQQGVRRARGHLG
jgi:hypothetical protein